MATFRQKHPPQKPNVVYFDIETQRSAEEVGGWSNVAKMRLAVAVTYSTDEQKYTTFLESDVDALVNQLKAADLIVGFNLLKFDYVALQPYTAVPLRRLPTFDMLEELYRVLGFRVGLDALASTTLGISKSADGLQSLRWWKAGQVNLVIEYCQKDVEITKRLFEHGCRQGYVQFPDRYKGIRRVRTNRWAEKARAICNRSSH